ncbi:hypothetical protein PVAND_006443 [Polypedilum vanderplanki]|uniref:LITAF domain-containing protein n=1 Tax=Polypedilum vanderplanki TaxID=319348 RepID=A0A9J6C3N1_POLVA|nr:hypothetical protein PVAND_006443 [Polypedilum vanderplanki]
MEYRKIQLLTIFFLIFNLRLKQRMEYRSGYNYFTDDNNPFRSKTMSSKLHSARPPSALNPKIIVTKPNSASATSIANHIAENGQESVALRCHGCDEHISSKLTYQANHVVHGTALILFITGCFIFSCLPYFMKSLKDIKHTCPKCEQFLGLYRRVNHLSPIKKFPSSDENYVKNQFQVASSGFSPNANSKSLNFGTPRWNSHTALPPVYSPSVQFQTVPYSMSPTYQQQVVQQQPPPPPFRQSSPQLSLTQSQEAKLSTIQNIQINGTRPLHVKCMHCSENVFTNIHYDSNLCVYLTALFLCSVSCLCCIPFFIKQIKDVRHSCPRCDTYLGTYRRWGL